MFSQLNVHYDYSSAADTDMNMNIYLAAYILY